MKSTRREMRIEAFNVWPPIAPYQSRPMVGANIGTIRYEWRVTAGRRAMAEQPRFILALAAAPGR